jgi:hypothetical protein
MGSSIRHNGINRESPAPTIYRTITGELPAQLITCRQQNNYESGTGAIQDRLQEMAVSISVKYYAFCPKIPQL